MSSYGRMSVICGPMFCGKTEELIRRLRRSVIAGATVKCYKPVIDDRYSLDSIASHSKIHFPTTPVSDSLQLKNLVGDVSDSCVVGIDEVQFFDRGITSVLLDFLSGGIDVVVAGLDLDFSNKPFDIVAALLAHADSITKLSAVCMKCRGEATKTFKKVHSSERIAVGGVELYEARCSSCHASGS